MDVIDLVEVYHEMRKRVNSFVYGIGMRLSSMYAKACITSCKASNS